MGLNIRQRITETRRALFGPSSPEIFREALNVVTHGEYSEAKNTPIRVEVINAGTPEHHHKLYDLEWDKQKFGPDVTDFGGHTATFKWRLGCKNCPYEVITSERALY